MEHKELIVLEKENIFKRILNKIKSLFKVKIVSQPNVNENSKEESMEFKNQLKVDISINEIWNKFDKGLISENDLNDNQKAKLKDLYKEKISEIDLKIKNCKEKILNIKSKYLNNET